MAYAALVSCVSVIGSSRRKPPTGNDGNGGGKARTTEGDAYAWFCVELLLDAIKTQAAEALMEREKEHRQKLLLTLVSTVPSVSLRLLPRLLISILELLEGSASKSHPSGAATDKDPSWDDKDDRKKLIKTFFEELLNMEDEEKEYALWWWGKHKERLAFWVEGRPGRTDVESADSDKEPEVVARTPGKGKARQIAPRL